MLGEFLEKSHNLLSDDYVVLKIDQEAMEHGAEVAQKLRGGRSGGIPWFAILDSDGRELVSSDGPGGNIGCPINEEECKYFVSMIQQTIQHAPSSRVDEIAKALDEFARPRRRTNKSKE